MAFSVTAASLFRQPAGATASVVGAVRSILTAGLVADFALSALSLTDALAVRLRPSPPMTLSPGTVAALIPESASVADQWIVTSPLYQPAPFGELVGAPLRLGAVLSMLNGPTEPDALLSALSVALPLTDWFAPSLLRGRCRRRCRS